MAPLTRSSVHGRSSGADMQTDSSGTRDNEASASDSEVDESSFMEQGAAVPFTSAQDLLRPLQETANRVSRQVEEFAKSLDRFNIQRDSQGQALWEGAFELLREYRESAHERREHTEATTRKGKDTERRLKDLNLEAHLWHLTERLLVCKCPEAVTLAEESAQDRLSSLHRYSSNFQVWEAFLDSDSIAQEYEVILDWLQETAADEEPKAESIESLIGDLIARSERGDGIWSSGLIYTKDAIKRQKRSRAWPVPLEPFSPGLRKTHVRKKDNEPLITQMDLDAVFREGARLEDPDEIYEESAWQTCWIMLRRGMKQKDIRQWWSDRKETWRSALLAGSVTSNAAGLDPNSQWLRMINIPSNQEWLARCREMAENKAVSSDWEVGVYGVLSGNHGASIAACDTVNDILFSYFNSVLIERYKLYLAAFRNKIENAEKVKFKPFPSSFAEVRKFMSEAEDNEQTKDELHSPTTFIEGAIMGQDFEEFFLQQGRAAAQVASDIGNGHLIESNHTSTVRDCAKLAAQDQDSVRIVAHLQLLLQELGVVDKVYKTSAHILDNNIISYMGYLERDHKFTLLPLYASKLSVKRIPQVMGTILIKVIDGRERDLQVKLMKQYGMDVPVILFGIFQLANYHEMERFKMLKDARRAGKVTELDAKSDDKFTKIKSGFMGDAVSELDARSIQSVEWMSYMDPKSWGMAAFAVAAIYKNFLLTGRLAAARELARSVSLRSTSLAATGMNLNLGLGLEEGSDNGDENGDGDVDMGASDNNSIDERAAMLSPRRRKPSIHILAKESTHRQTLAEQSQVWQQLEQLVECLSALERWQDLAHEIEANKNHPTTIRPLKREMKIQITALQSAMSSLLDPLYLTDGIAADEPERQALALIRTHYLPECVLGFNAALFFAGHYLSRSFLVECMNLAQEVATNDNLTKAFTQSGRMRELVSCFAVDSQALLRANEAGGPNRAVKTGGTGKGTRGQSRRDRDSIGGDGRGDIWNVEWRDLKDLDLAAID